MPASNNIDIELLAKIYQKSGLTSISEGQSNAIKKEKWQVITVKYCSEKNLPLMDYKTLQRKWSKFYTKAKKRKRGQGPSHLDPLLDIVLNAAEANADPSSDFDAMSDVGQEPGMLNNWINSLGWVIFHQICFFRC